MPSRAGPAAAGAIWGVVATFEAPRRLATRSQDGPVAAEALSLPPLPQNAPLPAPAPPTTETKCFSSRYFLWHDVSQEWARVRLTTSRLDRCYPRGCGPPNSLPLLFFCLPRNATIAFRGEATVAVKT